MKKLTKLQKRKIRNIDNISGLGIDLYNTIHKQNFKHKYTYNSVICSIELCRLWIQADFIREASCSPEELSKFKNPDIASVSICSSNVKSKKKNKKTKLNKIEEKQLNKDDKKNLKEQDIMFH